MVTLGSIQESRIGFVAQWADVQPAAHVKHAQPAITTLLGRNGRAPGTVGRRRTNILESQSNASNTVRMVRLGLISFFKDDVLWAVFLNLGGICKYAKKLCKTERHNKKLECI